MIFERIKSFVFNFPSTCLNLVRTCVRDVVVQANAVIIIISTLDNKDTIDAVIKNGGAKDYLIKPCDSSSIIMAASKQLVNSRFNKKKP